MRQEAIVILAAGQGSRLRSGASSKVLQPLCGVPLLSYILATVRAYAPARCVVVVGEASEGGEEVSAYARAEYSGVEIVRQARPRGTGDAVKAAAELLRDFSGRVTVLLGDVPFLSGQTLEALSAICDEKTIGLVGFETDRPMGYGRLVCADGGRDVQKIVEERDCSQAERQIGFCNSGMLSAPAGVLFSALDALSADNAAGEYYLTDCVAHARERGIVCRALVRPEEELLGINSRHDLVRGERVLQERLRWQAVEKGALLSAPETIFLAPDTVLADNAVIEPYVVFGAGVKVGAGAHIRAFSYLEGCEIGEKASIGPYARIRPESVVGQGAKVGNFVEVKNAHLKEGAKAGHLSYIGDSVVGGDANIGAGTITCNFDGTDKHQTDIGAGAFIGSNAALVAPLKIGEGAIIGAGSVITENVGAGGLALARAPQTERKDFTKRSSERSKNERTQKNTGKGQ